MTDPIAILDAKGRELYEAWLTSRDGRSASWNPFNGTRIKPEAWDRLDNHTREVWRGKALAALRSEETVADELRREARASATLDNDAGQGALFTESLRMLSMRDDASVAVSTPIPEEIQP